jgi:hypothetical protein
VTEHESTNLNFVDQLLPPDERSLISSTFSKTRRLNSNICDRIMEEINRLLKAKFIKHCRYGVCIYNIVLVEKKYYSIILEFSLVLDISIFLVPN